MTKELMDKQRAVKVFPSLGIALIVPQKCGTRSILQAINHSGLYWTTITQKELEAETYKWNIFGFVRNPFDRLVSFWAGNINKEKIEPVFTKMGFWGYMSFDACLETILSDVYGNAHYRPQADLIYGDYQVSRVFRFEHLEADWECFRTNYATLRRTHTHALPGSFGPLPHINKSKHNHWATYYNVESYNAVLSAYKKDFKLFYNLWKPVSLS